MFREEFELLDALQTRLALYPLTAPLLGNNHANFRGRGCPVGTLHIHNKVKLHNIDYFCPFHMFVILIFYHSFGVVLEHNLRHNTLMICTIRLIARLISSV